MYADFISIADLSADELLELLELADELKNKAKAGQDHRPLAGKTLGMVFEKPSLRTRVTFETGMYQLGGHAVFLQTTLGERETVPDIARNLERWVDAIVARTHSHEALLELASYSSVPVINALTDKLHPCQVLGDAQTIREHRGKLEGLKVVFVGDGNNVFASWANLATRFAFDLTLVCPEGYELRGEADERARNEAKGDYKVCNDPEEGVPGADVVYTDVWASMGQEVETAKRKKAFAPYQVDRRLMEMAGKQALFMHCLPAHRGEEVTHDVIESEQSIVFDQAENRLHAQKAILVTLMS
ncbi:MAG: ornithine carbamoyltransferase [Candidatus Hydrogenedentes bacterium]|nr:ornithine carbamoyltransferase [Candidatus Hydrogenedentota bacterium]